MWLNEHILNDISKVIFFANTPEYILDRIINMNLFSKIQIFHYKINEIENEINNCKNEALSNKINFSYYYFLNMYYVFLFNRIYDSDNIDYNQFPYLKNVLTLLLNSTTTNVINVKIEHPKVTIKVR